MANNVYFLDVQAWEKYGFINSNIDEAKLNPIILRVQETRIEPLLGTTLYDKLKNDAPTFTGLYKTLVDKYMIPVLIAYSDWKYTFHGLNQMSNKTVGKNDDQYIIPNSTEENNNLRDELYKDAKQYERKLIGWLQDNREDIPEYCNTPEDKKHQSIEPSQDKNNILPNFIIT